MATRNTPIPDEPQRRLCLGLLPSASVQAQVTAHMRAWQYTSESRSTAAHRLHLTLHFLGEVGFAHEQLLRAGLPRIRFAPFDLRFSTAQAWPNGIAVLLPQASQALHRLQSELGQLLTDCGLASQRHYTPHLTLARNAAKAKPPSTPIVIDWPVQGFYLLWSQLPPLWPRARYEVLERVEADLHP